jgi:hypothetical protein
MCESIYEHLRALSTPVLVFDLILYGLLPLWLIMGFLDYHCHRTSKIEESSGITESLLHAVMGVQIGIPIFLGLLFEINVGVLLIMLAALIFHEWVAHLDVAYARQHRQISMLEIHVHSFLETLPFFTVALIVCINWSAFVDLISFNWEGHLGLNPKVNSTVHYILGYVALMLFADIVPYIGELTRCWNGGKPKAFGLK